MGTEGGKVNRSAIANERTRSEGMDRNRRREIGI